MRKDVPKKRPWDARRSMNCAGSCKKYGDCFVGLRATLLAINAKLIRINAKYIRRAHTVLLLHLKEQWRGCSVFPLSLGLQPSKIGPKSGQLSSELDVHICLLHSKESRSQGQLVKDGSSGFGYGRPYIQTPALFERRADTKAG